MGMNYDCDCDILAVGAITAQDMILRAGASSLAICYEIDGLLAWILLSLGDGGRFPVQIPRLAKREDPKFRR